jgi:hypothetical protein
MLKVCRRTALPAKSSNNGLSGTRLALLDKDLISMGYFLASGQRIRKTGNRLIRSFSRSESIMHAEIIPDATYGFPVTSDQDQYLAFQKLISERLVRHGDICNPISFHAADLLRILRRTRPNGRYHARIREWIQVIAGTKIVLRESSSHPDTGKQRTVEFRVFDCAVPWSRLTNPSRTLDKHHVWLSDWQLTDLKQNHVIRIDLDTYLDLRHVIAKALLPHLHIWFYASRHKKHFEKHCKSLCHLLGLPPYEYRSQYYEKLGPALKELRQCGYLGGWAFEPGRMGLKIVLRAGDRFRGLLPSYSSAQSGCAESLPKKSADTKTRDLLLAEMCRRGILETVAQKILEDSPSWNGLFTQLQWGDHLLRQRSGITNPAGFYIHLIQSNATPPPGFASFPEMPDSEAIQMPEQLIRQRTQAQSKHDCNREQTVNTYIANSMTEAQYQALSEVKRLELLKRCKRARHWTTETTNRCLESAVRDEIARALTRGEQLSDTIQ